MHVCMYLLLTPGVVELSDEGINCCHSCNAMIFEGIELSVAVKLIYVKKKKPTKNKVINMR